jgi:hypothetical protein
MTTVPTARLAHPLRRSEAAEHRLFAYAHDIVRLPIRVHATDVRELVFPGATRHARGCRLPEPVAGSPTLSGRRGLLRRLLGDGGGVAAGQQLPAALALLGDRTWAAPCWLRRRAEITG